MAEKKVYIGSIGPFIYDDDDLIDDEDGDFSGEYQKALATTGDQIVEGESVQGDQNVTGVYKVDGVQVVTNQQSAISDASTSHGVTDWATTNTALDALGTKINSILAALRTHGLIDT